MALLSCVVRPFKGLDSLASALAAKKPSLPPPPNLNSLPIVPDWSFPPINATSVLPALGGQGLSLSFCEELFLAIILFFHSSDQIFMEKQKKRKFLKLPMG